VERLDDRRLVRAVYPDRFIPQTLVPLWDVPAPVSEIERCAAKGSRAVLFVENPHPLGLPSFPTGHWRPVFEASAATGLPLSMHIGTSMSLIRPSPETTQSVGIALCGINSMSALGDFIFSGAFNDLPDCRVALSEGGFGVREPHGRHRRGAVRAPRSPRLRSRYQDMAREVVRCQPCGLGSAGVDHPDVRVCSQCPESGHRIGHCRRVAMGHDRIHADVDDQLAAVVVEVRVEAGGAPT
jgi:predicted TIM-barrel fold metal-dependent hydrolase